MRLPYQPCQCSTPGITILNGAVVAWTCRQCLVAATVREHNLAWGGDGNVLPIKKVRMEKRPEKAAVPFPCVRRGELTGERATCAEGCGKGVKLPVLTCSLKGKCVIAKRTTEGHATCRDCKERQATLPEADVSGLRHLLYHVLPVAGNGIWQDNVDELRGRWHLFTGRKVVAVMTSRQSFTRTRVQGDHKQKWILDSVAEVRDYLPPGCEVIELVNDPELREVVSWDALWSSLVPYAADNDLIFYSHAKGVTRTSAAVERWTELMYSIALDHPELLQRVLSRYPVAGSFRRVGKSFTNSDVPWHYSGSMFWVRAEAMKKRGWNTIDRDWWGNEAWPGKAFSLSESGVFFKLAPEPNLDLFKEETWKHVEPEYAAWLARNPVELPMAVES